MPVLHFRGKIHLHLRGLQISSNLADSSVVRHQPTRHRFEPPDVAAFHSLAATILNIFAFGSVVLMAATERPNSGGVIEDQTAVALVAFAITILVCVPLFLASIGLAIYACYKHDPWGFAALFLNCLLIGGLILFSVIAKAIDTPERRAAQERQARERWAQRHAPPKLGGIDISTDSALYKAATSPWLLVGCFSMMGIGGLLLARQRAFSHSTPQTPDNTDSSVSPSSVIAKCPKCRADISGVLASGGVTCPTCNTQFLYSASRRSTRNFAEGLLSEGSSLKRIAAAICIIALLLFGLMWVWFAALGNSQMSNRMLLLLLPLGLAFAAILAHHSFSSRSG